MFGRKRTEEPVNGKVFLVDVSDNLYPFIPDELKKDAVILSHAVPVNTTVMTIEEDDKLNQYAVKLLDQYKKEAKLVITSRLHAAAPCIAMGIPVVLASDNIDFRYSWLDKYVPIYTLDEYDSIDWNPMPVSAEEVKEWIPTYIAKRIKNDPTAVDELIKLDEYYMTRNRVDYYGYFRKRIIEIVKKINNDKFRYIIWGAGLHSGYAYDIIKELYPNAELKAVIDKYETGKRFGIDIQKGSDFSDKDFDIAFITTRPGTPDAIEKMEEFFGDKAENHYVVITSQQKS